MEAIGIGAVSIRTEINPPQVQRDPRPRLTRCRGPLGIHADTNRTKR
jgi:hypothetical protein